MAVAAMAITATLSCSRICTSCISFPTVSLPRPVPCIPTRRTTKPSNKILNICTAKVQFQISAVDSGFSLHSISKQNCLTGIRLLHTDPEPPPVNSRMQGGIE
uniref:Putative secreted protein n=1 Tax=Anopheles darlingi TaxID=43151 RepID=A0A2M4DKW8_ANODA